LRPQEDGKAGDSPFVCSRPESALIRSLVVPLALLGLQIERSGQFPEQRSPIGIRLLNGKIPVMPCARPQRSWIGAVPGHCPSALVKDTCWFGVVPSDPCEAPAAVVASNTRTPDAVCAASATHPTPVKLFKANTQFVQLS